MRRFKACADLQADLSKHFDRLDLYAQELSAEDTGVPATLELRRKSVVVATTASEAFLLEHMRGGAKNDDERLLYLGSALEGPAG